MQMVRVADNGQCSAHYCAYCLWIRYLCNLRSTADHMSVSTPEWPSQGDVVLRMALSEIHSLSSDAAPATANPMPSLTATKIVPHIRHDMEHLRHPGCYSRPGQLTARVGHGACTNLDYIVCSKNDDSGYVFLVRPFNPKPLSESDKA